MSDRVKSLLKKNGLSGVNKPKRTPNHPTKSHVVMAAENGRYKILRFGEQGAKTAGKPKAGESAKMKAKRKSFKARHRKNIKRGKMSAAWWSSREKWRNGGKVKKAQRGSVPTTQDSLDLFNFTQLQKALTGNPAVIPNKDPGFSTKAANFIGGLLGGDPDKEFDRNREDVLKILNDKDRLKEIRDSAVERVVQLSPEGLSKEERNAINKPLFEIADSLVRNNPNISFRNLANGPDLIHRNIESIGTMRGNNSLDFVFPSPNNNNSDRISEKKNSTKAAEIEPKRSKRSEPKKKEQVLSLPELNRLNPNIDYNRELNIDPKFTQVRMERTDLTGNNTRGKITQVYDPNTKKWIPYTEEIHRYNKGIQGAGFRQQSGGIPAYSPYAINQPIPQLNQFAQLLDPTGRGIVSPFQSKPPIVPGQLVPEGTEQTSDATTDTPQTLLQKILETLNNSNGLSNVAGQFGGNSTGNNIGDIFSLLQNGPANTGATNNVLTSSQGFLGFAELGGKPGQRTKTNKMKKKKLTAAEKKLRKILKEQEDRINEFRTDLVLDEYENQKKQSISLFNQKYGDSGLSLQEIAPRSGASSNPRNYKRGGKVKRKRKAMRYQAGGVIRARIQEDGTVEGNGDFDKKTVGNCIEVRNNESGSLLDRRCFPDGIPLNNRQISSDAVLNSSSNQVPADRNIQLRPTLSRSNTGLSSIGDLTFSNQFDPRDPLRAQAALDGLRESEINRGNDAKSRSDDRVGKNYTKGFKEEVDRRGLTTKEDVIAFQNILRSEGFDIKADGVYGKETADAAESMSRRRTGDGGIPGFRDNIFDNTVLGLSDPVLDPDYSTYRPFMNDFANDPNRGLKIRFRQQSGGVPLNNQIGNLPIPGQVGLNNILPNGQVAGGNLGQSPTTYSPLLLSLEQQQALSRQNQLASLGVPQQTQTLQGGGDLLSAVLSANGVPNQGAGAVVPNPGFRPQAPQVPNTRTPIRANGLLGGVEPVVVPGTDITFGDPRLDGITTLLTKIPGMNAVIETPLAEARVTVEGVDISESRQKGDRKSNESKRIKRRRPKGRGCKITPFEGGMENPHKPKVSRRKKYR